ncbi:MAG: hypothetical protein ABIJ57_05830, partial [Pseudomonadota bacterium]
MKKLFSLIIIPFIASLVALSSINASPPMYATAYDPAAVAITGGTISGITDLTMSGDINTAYATVASHATTSAIWAAAGNIINFTGT